ncbi:DNA adenine methylase [Foetidibacter luteolus]|uniref:DNA adenine methylase n=1 Tax=Foetidibacter luteolus TaxID=2608880 RepID=UPI00129A319D|nr:Dam family site-specific DNA-(adenine-N6)-methyltransferase [Foetidibacter luteolus]
MTKSYSINNEESSNVLEDLFQPYNVGARPFLKWAGGKSQLLFKFQELYPKELKARRIKKYYEPFLGSGAVFFDIVQNFDIDAAFLYDINEELIITYRVIQQDVNKLIDFLKRYQKTYHKLTKIQRKQYFYDQRHSYNTGRFTVDYDKYSESWIPRAAQLIFLNKTCFNGLYRVNSKGEFNTPVGDYDKPTICDEMNLLAVSKVLEKATIRKADFKQIKKDYAGDGFIYFDPPYRPISKTASFKSYSKHDFGDSEQLQLAELFTRLNEKGAQLMLSNSDPKNIDPSDNFFDEIYQAFNIQRIPAKRMINSDASKRGEIQEIVITNY